MITGIPVLDHRTVLYYGDLQFEVDNEGWVIMQD